MKKNIKIIQLILVSIGFFLILVTYIVYPKMNESKIETKNIIKQDNNLSNSFENVVCLIYVENGSSMATKIKKKYV